MWDSLRAIGCRTSTVFIALVVKKPERDLQILQAVDGNRIRKATTPPKPFFITELDSTDAVRVAAALSDIPNFTASA